MREDPERSRPKPSNPAFPPLEETELVAYLDGELDPESASRMQERLARDPAARTLADSLKKSYDLLDYLPMPEPKPDFTSRTLTRLQPAIAGSASGLKLTGPRRIWPELCAWTGAGLLVLILSFVGRSLAHLSTSSAVVAPEEPTLADLEVIERLPLYAGVDDLAFLKQLDALEPFGDDGLPPLSKTAAEPTTVEDRARLIEQFRQLPANRQQQLRTLHQELKTLDPKIAPDILKTLHGYAAWLHRLPDGERKKILSATSCDERIQEIRHTKETQWRLALTPRQKERLRNVQSTADRENLAAEFRQQEFVRREEWELAHRQWQLVSEQGQTPWPFNEPKRVDEIEKYIRVVLGADLAAAPPDRKAIPDPQPHCRLTREQFVELKSLHDAAKKEGNWSWMFYGACLLRLSNAHPSLPLPRDGKPVTTLETLPKEYRFFTLAKFDLKNPGAKPAWTQQLGKWPDFANYVHDLAARRTKGDQFPQLGPCRPSEFTEDVTKFVKEQLQPVLASEEKASLSKLEGKWPEYPRKMIELAQKHDLSVPGVTLPGAPSQWDKFYRLPTVKK